ncbi:RNA exonuclease 5-like [Anneissia japonica]|uniref:RNA exonuclease 5-like n=1 Tax=Anneissia japonica TaxID=1529436 RepID=UPI001425AC94|nr:RNA exonuclease 5-like [Anneissia japonica]
MGKKRSLGDEAARELLQTEEKVYQKGSLQKLLSHEPPKKKKKKDKVKTKHETYKKLDSIDAIENVEHLVKEESEKSKTKKQNIERIKKSMQRPKIFLNQSDQIAVNMSDVQDLVQFACIGAISSAQPKWCKLLRVAKVCKVAVVIVSGINERWFTQYSHCFTNMQQLFNLSVKVHPVDNSDRSVYRGFLFTKWRAKRYKKELYMSKLLEKEPDLPTHNESDDASDEEDTKPTRSDYVLTEEEMRWHGYPTPDRPGFISTKHADTISDASPLIAIDCEMSMTHNGQELTRVSVVNEKLEVLYDTLVKPYNKIVDYCTKYSGITKELLNPVTTRLEDVQKKLLKLIPPDAILVGQSLNGDLMALKMYHPHCIDTSDLFTNKYRVGLKILTKHYLKRDIQCSKSGHDSTEDAQASMELFLLKLKKGSKLEDFSYKKSRVLPIESIFQRVATESKSSVLIDVPSNLKKFSKDPVNCITAMTDAETTKRMKQVVRDKYDLICGHLHSFKTLMDGITHEQHTIESTLANVDRRVSDIYAAVPDNSLFVVLLASGIQGLDNLDTGFTEKDLYSRCFAGIKYAKEPDAGT